MMIIVRESLLKEKSVDAFIQRQRCFISPKKIDIGFNPITQKEESIQYIPLFPTLQAIMQHEDALSHLLAENSIPGSGSDKSILSFRDGTACKENQIFKAWFSLIVLTLKTRKS